MTEIRVIEDTESFIDITKLSQDEREMLFDRLAQENQDIPKFQFDSFSELLFESIKLENKLIKPELKELLLRKIIQLSINQIFGQFNVNVIPIIPSFVNLTFKRESTRTHAYGHRMPMMGGANPKGVFKKVAKVANEIIPDAIKVRFDTPIRTITQNGLDYIVPPNEEVNIVGFIIYPICANISKSPDAIALSTINVIDIRESIDDKVLIGNYNHTTLASYCDDTFSQPNYKINIAGEYIMELTRIMFNKYDESKLLTVFNAIFDYLKRIISYQHSKDAALLIFNELSNAINSMSITGEKLAKIISYAKSPGSTQITPLEDPKSPMDDFLASVETIINSKLSKIYDMSLIYGLDTSGFLKLYYRAIIKGKDSAEVKQILEIHRIRRKRIEFQRDVRNKILDEINILNTYKFIIEKKLGIQRANAIDSELKLNPHLLTKSSNILELLKPHEKKLVVIEYERREKYLESVINNKCPHVKISRMFRTSINEDRTKKFYNELKAFFKDGNQGDMIKCNNCGFDIICPHMKEFTELDFAGKEFGEIKAKLTKYIANIPVKDQYYCKICGEVISTIEAFGSVSTERESSTMMSEDLKMLMWGEIAGSIKWLRFGALVNIPKLIVAIRDICYPYIFEIEKQILKAKTNTAEEIKSKKRLFITIYAFAYLVHLIASNINAKGDAEISFRNFKSSNPKNSIIDLIKHALGIIISSKNIIIREIGGMTNDIIKNKLIEAYKALSLKGPSTITYGTEAENIFVTLTMDPLYSFIYNVNAMDDGKAKKSKFDIVEKLEDYMGGNILKLEKSDDVFEFVKVPKFEKWNIDKFNSIKPVLKGITNVNINERNASTFTESNTGYIARSFQHFYDRIHSKLYRKYVYMDTAAVVDKKNKEAVVEGKFRPEFENYHQKYSDLFDKEAILFQHWKMEHMKNYYFHEVKNTLQNVALKVSLGRVYDEDGNLHKFDIYVVQDAKTTTEITVKDAAKNVEAGNRFAGKIIDKKCSVCGQLYSTSSTLHEDKILSALQNKGIVSNFFRFFESRCPKGGLHEFEDIIKCNKCNMNIKFISQNDSKEAMAFYREYRSQYQKERDEFKYKDTELIDDKTVTRESFEGKMKNLSKKYEAEYSRWTFNFNQLLDLSNKLKINTNILSCLGSVEKQEYNDILTGNYIPPEAEKRNDTRIFTIASMIKNLITEYNMLRYFHRLVKPPVDLMKLIDSSGINKHKINELPNKLVLIYDEFNDRFEYFKSVKKPREIVAFVVQTFCDMCLKIWNNSDKETEKLRHSFVDYIVKKITKHDELVSKPGPFNWSLLYGEKETKTATDYDSNYDPDVDQNEDQVDEEEEEDKLVGTTADAFKGDQNLDVESDSDDFNEGNESNQIRVEGYSLD